MNLRWLRRRLSWHRVSTVSPQCLRVVVLDNNGEPVYDAVGGTFVVSDRDAATASEEILCGARDSDIRSNAQGELLFNCSDVFGDAPRARSASVLVVRHDARQLGAVVSVDPGCAGLSREVRLNPLCTVRWRLRCPGLSSLGRAVVRPILYVYYNDSRFMQVRAEVGPIACRLPPGRYMCDVYAMNTYIRRVPITVRPDKSELECEADLVAHHVACLCGHAAPELLAMKVWANGRSVRLRDLQGKVVILHFWRSNCGSCFPYLSFLKELHAAVADSRVCVVAIHDGSLNSMREVEAALNRAGVGTVGGGELPFYMALDTNKTVRLPGTRIRVKGETTGCYGISFVPTSLVLDQRGIVRGHLMPDIANGQAQLQSLLLAQPITSH